MPKLKHLDDYHTVRFITFSCYRRQPYLNLPYAKEILIDQIGMARKRHSFKLLGYVLMPEHVHLVIYPQPNTRVGYIIGAIKSHMAKRYFISVDINSGNLPNVFWQKRCYDHNCRSVSAAKEKINYIHNNPVKRGLVKSPGDWRWSSYNWYCGKRDVPISIDSYEF
jgi:putative transposase